MITSVHRLLSLLRFQEPLCQRAASPYLGPTRNDFERRRHKVWAECRPARRLREILKSQVDLTAPSVGVCRSNIVPGKLSLSFVALLQGGGVGWGGGGGGKKKKRRGGGGGGGEKGGEGISKLALNPLSYISSDPPICCFVRVHVKQICGEVVVFGIAHPYDRMKVDVQLLIQRTLSAGATMRVSESLAPVGHRGRADDTTRVRPPLCTIASYDREKIEM